MLVFVSIIEFACRICVKLKGFEIDYLKALLFKSGNNFSNNTLFESIRFYHNKGLLKVRHSFPSSYFLTLIPPLTYFLVHFNFLGSRFKFMFFLHLGEHVHCMEPSFFTDIIPVSVGICFPQKKQFRRDVAALLKQYHYFIFLASLSVSLNMRISFILTEPLTFLVRIRPLSFPSKTFTLTWITSPAIPVLPTI